ncbi:MAG: MarR family winged helix-turn-helix transcriptional regulator [Bacteroidia bacterium]
MSKSDFQVWESLGLSLIRINALLRRSVRRIAYQNQIGLTEVEVLQVVESLAGNEWCQVKDIYPMMDLTRAAIVRSVHQACWWGFLEQKRHEEDKRRILVRLTEKGKKLLQEVHRLRAQQLAHLYSQNGVNIQELQRLVLHLQKIAS